MINNSLKIVEDLALHALQAGLFKDFNTAFATASAIDEISQYINNNNNNGNKESNRKKSAGKKSGEEDRQPGENCTD